MKRAGVGLMVSVIGLSIGIPGWAGINGQEQKATTAFESTAHDLFVKIRSEADNLAAQASPVAGQITLKDPATAVITPNSGVASTDGLASKAFYTIPLNSSDTTLTLTGNLSGDNKSWCFDLKTQNADSRVNELLYNQLGNTSSTGYCLDGLAYNSSDQLVK